MTHLQNLVQDKSHVLWDFNGTLLDDAHVCTRAVNVLLSEHKLPTISVEEYHQKFRFPVSEYYIELGFDFTKESYSSLSDRFHDLYHSWLDQAGVYPGTHDILKTLSHLNHHVLSAAHIDDLHRMIHKFNLKPHFSSVYGLSDRLAHSKVDLGRSLLKEQGLNPADCVMFGDTLHDLEVASELGVEIYLIAGGHQSEERLRTKTDRVIARTLPI